MVKEKVFIGVDGGGTYTTVVAVTETGKVLGRVVGEQTNFYDSNMNMSRTNLKNTVDKLIKEHKILDYECISIGMSSLDSEPSRDFIKLFSDGIFPSEKIEMHSDAYMALMGMTLGKPGVMVVSGTGSMAIAVDRTGKEHVIGGWGYLLQDEGSSYYIAIQGIDGALKSYEGLGEKTILEKNILDFFGADTHRQLIDIFYNPPISKSRIASFGKEVINAALQGDAVALSIVDKAVKALVNYACNLIKKVGDEECIVGMYGSVLRKNPLISSLFTQQIHAVYPRAKVGVPDLEPEIGAVLFGMKKRGFPITEDFLRNVRRK